MLYQEIQESITKKFFKILLRAGRIEIGLYDAGSLGFLPSPLYTGCTIASLKISGNMPVLRLILQILAIGPAKTFMPFFNTSVEMPSAPIASVNYSCYITCCYKLKLECNFISAIMN